MFPTGWVHDPVTDVLSVYYGAGDKVIGLATSTLAEVLRFMAQAPKPNHRQTADGDVW